MNKKRALLALVILAALVAAYFALTKISNRGAAAAANADETSRPRIEKLEASRPDLPRGESTDLTINARGANVARYALSAKCPSGVSLSLNGKDACDRTVELSAAALAGETIAASVSDSATGTAAISVRVIKPDAPIAPWTQRVILLKVE